MPIPKCAPDQVYVKELKKCIKIGGETYKAILNKNPNAFKHYSKKIAAALKTSVKPKNNMSLANILKSSKPKTPIDKCSKDEVYSKITKRCVKIGGQTYKKALKTNTTVFNDQKNKI